MAKTEERDFTEIQLKLNASGSWMNVGLYKTDDEPAVRAACETLHRASKCRIRFKILDADGGLCASLPGRGEHSGRWQDH